MSGVLRFPSLLETINDSLNGRHFPCGGISGVICQGRQGCRRRRSAAPVGGAVRGEKNGKRSPASFSVMMMANITIVRSRVLCERRILCCSASELRHTGSIFEVAFSRSRSAFHRRTERGTRHLPYPGVSQ